MSIEKDFRKQRMEKIEIDKKHLIGEIKKMRVQF